MYPTIYSQKLAKSTDLFKNDQRIKFVWAKKLKVVQTTLISAQSNNSKMQVTIQHPTFVSALVHGIYYICPPIPSGVEGGYGSK